MAIGDTSGSSSCIAAKTKFRGEINSKSDSRVDGEVEGTFQASSELVMDRAGVINGIVICENADIEGRVASTIKINSVLSLKSTAVVGGEVYVDKLSVEPGAVSSVAYAIKGDRNFTNGKQ